MCIDHNIIVQKYFFVYVHQDVLNSYNDAAIFYDDSGQIEKAKNKYIEIIEKTDYYSKGWTEDDKSYGAGYSIDDVKLSLNVNAFFNYFFLITRNFKEKYTIKDKEIVEKWEDFLNKNKEKIKNSSVGGSYSKYQEYLLKAKTYIYWYEKEPKEIIAFMDDALEMLNSLLKQKKDKYGKRDGRTQFQIEDAINWFWRTKEIKIKEAFEIPEVINFYYEKLENYKKWKERETIFPTLETYEELCWIYNNEKDWKNLRKTSLQAFKVGSEFIER